MASAVHSCLALLFHSLLSLIERCLRGSRERLIFLFSLLSAICPSAPAPAQPVEAPILLPHPPRRLIPGVKLSPPQSLSSAQANLQRHPHFPPPRANLGSSQRRQFSRWEFWTIFLPIPSSGVPGRVFAAPGCLGAVRPSALPQPRSLPGAGSPQAWRGLWGPLRAQSAAAQRDQRRDHSLPQSRGPVGSLGSALLPKAMSNFPRFQHGEENRPDL